LHNKWWDGLGAFWVLKGFFWVLEKVICAFQLFVAWLVWVKLLHDPDVMLYLEFFCWLLLGYIHNKLMFSDEGSVGGGGVCWIINITLVLFWVTTVWVMIE
jgi:hypothetical protein